MKSNSIILLFTFLFLIMQIAFSQSKLSEALISINNLKPIELKDYVQLVYNNKRGSRISLLVPRHKLPKLKKLSKNEDDFLDEILISDSIFYFQNWYFLLIEDIDYSGIDTSNLFQDSEIGRYNYSIYKSNYEYLQRKIHNQDKNRAVTRINKRLTIVDSECNYYYSGYIHVNFINTHNKRVSTNLINLKWENIMIPFVFFSHVECDKW